MTGYALQVQDLRKEYSSFTLKNVSFSLPKGCIMGMIGENGAGKTTTIKSILGLCNPDGGEITCLGEKITEQNEEKIKQRIAVVFDENHFPESMNALQAGKIMQSIYRDWDHALFQQYLNRFHLSEKKLVKEYSRGMKMKLNIAVALSHHPELLILDEATSGLDPIVREEILDLFLEYIQDENHSILFSSHITTDLDKIADYITFIHQGEVVFSKDKTELIESSGILKCSESALEEIDPEYIMRVRQGAFGSEALIEKRQEFRRKYPDHIVDRASVEDIMLFMIKGKTLCRKAVK